jgi:hypothetical protein
MFLCAFDAVNGRNKSDCGVAIHCKQFGHHMRFEDTQVPAEERYELKRRLLESMFIEEYKQRDDCFLLNVKAGDEIPEIWKGMLWKEEGSRRFQITRALSICRRRRF